MKNNKINDLIDWTNTSGAEGVERRLANREKNRQKILDGIIMEENIKKWMQEWVDRTSQVKYENSFNENSEEWIEIEGIGRFKGLEIVSEHQQDINEITINLKYDVWDKKTKA